jgi:hypothetical protein
MPGRPNRSPTWTMVIIWNRSPRAPTMWAFSVDGWPVTTPRATPCSRRVVIAPRAGSPLSSSVILTAASLSNASVNPMPDWSMLALMPPVVRSWVG